MEFFDFFLLIAAYTFALFSLVYFIEGEYIFSLLDFGVSIMLVYVFYVSYKTSQSVQETQGDEDGN